MDDKNKTEQDVDSLGFTTDVEGVSDNGDN